MAIISKFNIWKAKAATYFEGMTKSGTKQIYFNTYSRYLNINLQTYEMDLTFCDNSKCFILQNYDSKDKFSQKDDNQHN